MRLRYEIKIKWDLIIPDKYTDHDSLKFVLTVLEAPVNKQIQHNETFTLFISEECRFLFKTKV